MCQVRSRSARRWVATAFVVAVLTVAAGCTDDAGERDAVQSSDPGLSHIHGLGVDPASGALYAASHHGVFRVEDGAATRQGELWQDTMGFTVAGPDHFLGSGHPDFLRDTVLDEDMTPLLGLIESDDAARTWSAISLQGEVDFHALSAVGDRIYGYDSTGGRLMVSEDGGESWASPSADLAITSNVASLAVNVSDPDVVVAAAEHGVIRSVDGGVSWERLDGAPALGYVSWDEEGALLGIDLRGVLYQSDDGRSWQEVGRVHGQPAALLAAGGDLYVATAEAILSSPDGGETFETAYAIPDRGPEIVE